MGSESIEASFLSIFALISFFIFLIISKYSLKLIREHYLTMILLNLKHFIKYPVTRSGGIAVYNLLIIFFYFYYLLYKKILYDYILISYSMFLIGFLDDLKINIKPKKTFLLWFFCYLYLYFFYQLKY